LSAWDNLRHDYGGLGAKMSAMAPSHQFESVVSWKDADSALREAPRGANSRSWLAASPESASVPHAIVELVIGD